MVASSMLDFPIQVLRSSHDRRPGNSELRATRKVSFRLPDRGRREAYRRTSSMGRTQDDLLLLLRSTIRQSPLAQKRRSSSFRIRIGESQTSVEMPQQKSPATKSSNRNGDGAFHENLNSLLISLCQMALRLSRLVISCFISFRLGIADVQDLLSSLPPFRRP
jgi:hypothetical protein